MDVYSPATRAVHIEMAADLTTDSFLNALRKFVARRKGVTHLYSDNGSNFVGAERVLKEDSKICDQKQVQEETRLIGVNWSFNPPYASHFGEAWKRQIRTVRKIMKNLFSGAVYTDDVLQTVLCEVESVINSRPLSPVTFLCSGLVGL